MKFFEIKNMSQTDIEIHITGDIVTDEVEWLYKWFDDPYTSPNKIKQMLEPHTGKNITVFINSNGGYVTAGAAIYTALKEHRGEITVKISGAAVSAASVIAMAGDRVLMSPASLMMIHNPWSAAVGDIHEMQKSINALTACKDMIMNAYEIKTKLSRAEISQLMDAETWFSPQDAIEKGFADGMLYQSGQKDEEDEELDFKNLISGAKLIYNSANKYDVAEMYKKYLQAQENQGKAGDILNDEDDEETEILKLQLDLERSRYNL